MKNVHKPTMRVLEILNLVSKENNLTLTEISKKLDISKSTIQPILKTLVFKKYLSMDNNDKTYQINVGAFLMGQSYLKNSNMLDIIKLSMKEIVNEVNEICQLGIYNENNKSIFYLAKEVPDQPINLVSKIGTSLPAYATALGKSILSFYSNEYIRKNFTNKMIPLTNNTVTDIDIFLDEIDKIRKNGFAIDNEAVSEGIHCIAVPLIKNKEVFAALSVSIPVYRLDDDKFLKIKHTLLKEKRFLDKIFEDTDMEL